MWSNVIIYLNYAVLVFFIFIVLNYTILLISSFSLILNFFNRERLSNEINLLEAKSLPPITVIIPAYNEEETIVDSVYSALKSKYANINIMVINDASKDKTLSKLIDTFKMKKLPTIIQNKIPAKPVKSVYVSTVVKNLIVIDKVNGGRADSINVGVNASVTPYFLTLDADTLMDENAISELVFEVLTYPNTIVASGGVYILNGCDYKDGTIITPRMPYTLVPAIQSSEYIRSHLFNRTAWNYFGGTMCYSGTATLYDRKKIVEVGGYDTANFADDNEIIVRLHAYMHEHNIPYQMRFNPSSTFWTDVPHGFIEFAKQRNHWRRGMLRSTLKYFRMFLNPRYKIQGLLGYPVFMLADIFSPYVEFTAYFTVTLAYFLGILNGYSLILYLLLAWGFTSYITLTNMFLNLVTYNRFKKLSDILWMFALATVEMFGFRQYLVIINIYSTFQYIYNRMIGKPC